MRQLSITETIQHLQEEKAAASEAEVIELRQFTDTTKPTSINDYVPFPNHLLPFPVAEFIEQSAAALSCDMSYVALPLLSVLASTIGTTRRICLRPGWCEPAVIWTCVVGESGTLKSPAIDASMKILRQRQHEEIQKYTELLRAHEKELQRWNDAPKQERGDKPEEPVCPRLYVDDLTIEALVQILTQNSRGLLSIRDELAGWLLSFDAYRSGKGGDLQKWLSIHRGMELTVDRKKDRIQHVPRAAVSVTGGIQPETLNRIMGRDLFDNGLAARFLFACPPKKAKVWSETDVDASVSKRMEALLGSLLDLNFEEDEHGLPQPYTYHLTPDALARWREFYNQHAEEQINQPDSDLESAWSKLEGYAARFALIIHSIKTVNHTRALDDPDQVDLVTLNAGIALSDWFGNETKRVYGKLSNTKSCREREELIEWIMKHGGKATVRDLQRGFSRYRTDSGLAYAALKNLEQHGLGKMEEIQRDRGRPTYKFSLTIGDNSDNSDNRGKP